MYWLICWFQTGKIAGLLCIQLHAPLKYILTPSLLSICCWSELYQQYGSDSGHYIYDKPACSVLRTTIKRQFVRSISATSSRLPQSHFLSFPTLFQAVLLLQIFVSQVITKFVPGTVFSGTNALRKWAFYTAFRHKIAPRHFQRRYQNLFRGKWKLCFCLLASQYTTSCQ